MEAASVPGKLSVTPLSWDVAVSTRQHPPLPVPLQTLFAFTLHLFPLLLLLHLLRLRSSHSRAANRRIYY